MHKNQGDAEFRQGFRYIFDNVSDGKSYACGSKRNQGEEYKDSYDETGDASDQMLEIFR